MTALTRRRAIAIGGALLLPFARPGAGAGRTYGRVTVAGWVHHRNRTGEELRVTLDGEDVTDRCVLANDRAGFVVLQRLTGDGKTYVDTRGRIAIEKRRGAVRIAPAAAGDRERHTWRQVTMRIK